MNRSQYRSARSSGETTGPPPKVGSFLDAASCPALPWIHAATVRVPATRYVEEIGALMAGDQALGDAITRRYADTPQARRRL